MNRLVSITGPSGVGKSTISKIILICLGYKDSVIISGDDCHLWERGDENWKFFTHLNPIANDLSNEYDQILSLLNNKTILRKKYDHSCGKFTDAVNVFPKKNIIYEGLHTMQGKLSEISDISFYIDVEKTLKNEWKIYRDSNKRGYSIDKIVKTIENRKKDEIKFIEPQKSKCDVIIKFKKSIDGKINLSFDYKDVNLTGLINKIKKLYSLLQEFVWVSKQISKNIFLSQNKGGNLSFKFDDVIVITESGSSFNKINYLEGFGFYDLKGNSIFSDQKRPSMEIGCHLKLGPCCLHTHPLHLMAILCSKQSNTILERLYDNVKILDYCSPGKELQNAIQYDKNLFLKNHGIFISRESLVDCYNESLKYENEAKNFLHKKNKNKSFLFPDAFILQNENQFYHSFIKDLAQTSGLTLDYLSEEEILKLDNMEEEKYRKSIK